jgi:hypothetical protein
MNKTKPKITALPKIMMPGVIFMAYPSIPISLQKIPLSPGGEGGGEG